MSLVNGVGIQAAPICSRERHHASSIMREPWRTLLISFASQTTAVARGAEIETGGRRDRAVVQSTVLSNTPPHLNVETEEIFFPVMNVGV